MKENLHYGTVTDAINNLKQQGFNLDFNLAENCIVCNGQKFHPDDFEIVDIFRYEGDTDPGGEAAVYAIESKSGLKGILVRGYGISSDTMSTKMLEKLNSRRE